MITTGGKNTAVVGVDGNFDDCQTGVKAIFAGELLPIFLLRILSIGAVYYHRSFIISMRMVRW